MKRIGIVIVLITSFLTPIQNVIAANVTSKTAAKLAVVNIQKSIVKTTSDLRNLGENAIVGDSKIAIKYRQLLAPITNRYLSDKSAAELKVASSLADLNRNSNFVIQWDNFEACNGKCIKGLVYNFPFNTTIAFSNSSSKM